MKKMSKQTKKNIGIITILYFVLILITIKGDFIYGSNVDWLKQHVTFADYFRNLFYETKQLLPNFAPHLGAGQNIFYFAYYGFLNPIILLSYFFPFIKMADYIMISSILLNLIAIYLFYYFIKRSKYSDQQALFATLLFVCSASIMFHFHRHIMFVNYLPFLLIGLIGTQKYIDEKKSGLVILSTSLMILTSFYYSIPSILCLCIYALFYYLRQTKTIKWNNLVKTAFQYVLRILLGILLAAFFLLPTMYVIKNGRTTTEVIFELNMLKPTLPLDFLLYNSYGIGLTAISIIALLTSLFEKKKENKILAILLLLLCSIPIFNILLNGGLYQNGKVWIPLIPLFLILILEALQNAEWNKKHIIPCILSVIIFLVILQIPEKYQLLFYIDSILTFIFFFLYTKKKKEIFLLPILLMAIIISISSNQSDSLITKKEYKAYKESLSYQIPNRDFYRYTDQIHGANKINYSSATNDFGTSLYSSTSNPFLAEAYYNTFNNNDIYRNNLMFAETNNLFFHKLIGSKYLIADKNIPYGYHQIDKKLYETDNVYPIGFARNQIMSQKEFQQLHWHEQQEALLTNIIIKEKTENPNRNFQSLPYQLEIGNYETKNISFTKTGEQIKIQSKNNGEINLKLKEPLQNQTLLIRFQMNYIPSCKENDTEITINGIKNKLTCKTWKYYNHNETFDYVISSNKDIQELNIKLSKGNYELSNFEFYTIENTFFKNSDITPLHITEFQGDVLKGTITIDKPSYLLLTIPYDKGFTFKVDGKVTPYQLANEAFIGIQLNEGSHQIEMHYEAPYFKLGKIVSLITGICLILGITIKKYKKSDD